MLNRGGPSIEPWGVEGLIWSNNEKCNNFIFVKKCFYIWCVCDNGLSWWSPMCHVIFMLFFIAWWQLWSVFYSRMYYSVCSMCVCLSACTAQWVPLSNSITVLGSSVVDNLYYYYYWYGYCYVLCPLEPTWIWLLFKTLCVFSVWFHFKSH